jgi:hypothetical protein
MKASIKIARILTGFLIVVPFPSIVMMQVDSKFFSLSLNGLQRTATFTLVIYKLFLFN